MCELISKLDRTDRKRERRRKKSACGAAWFSCGILKEEL